MPKNIATTFKVGEFTFTPKTRFFTIFGVKFITKITKKEMPKVAIKSCYVRSSKGSKTFSKFVIFSAGVMAKIAVPSPKAVVMCVIVNWFTIISLKLKAK